MQPCGFCGGRGYVLGSQYDNHGAKRHAEPPRLTCEYCGGAGQCEDGQKLLPATEPQRDDSPVNAGLPPWA